MLHPSREVEKVYLARVSNQVTAEEARRLENGVIVDGGAQRAPRLSC